MTALFRLVCLLALISVSKCATAHAGEVTLQTGDVVLQASKSSRAELIRLATRSEWSHVGLVEVAPDGVFVIEAIQPVSRTPWARWKARGIDGRVLLRRPVGLDDTQRARVVARAKTWLGTPYDARYRWDDARMYCSELVTKAFRVVDLPVGTLQSVASLPAPPALRQLAPRLGVSLATQLVTPASIAADAHLMTVAELR